MLLSTWQRHKLCSVFPLILCCHFSCTDRDSKHWTDSTNNSLSGESNTQIRTQKRLSSRLGLLIAAALCRAQRGLVREQLVQSATWCPPACAHLHSHSLFGSASFSVEKGKKSSHFSASGFFLFFLPLFYVLLFTCNKQQVSPTCWKRDTRAWSCSTFGASERRNHRDESTGAAVTLTRNRSQRELSSAPGFFCSLLVFLLTAVYSRQQAAEGKYPARGRGAEHQKR